MKYILSILISIYVFVGCESNNKKVIEPKRNNIDSIYSKTLNEYRDFFIHVPASSDTTKKEYPVLYILDANAHFEYASTIVEFLYSWKEIPELIIVGINQKDRFKDLSFSKDAFFDHECNAPNFLLFINNELIPYIDSVYCTNSERFLYGHSLGSMFVLNTYFNESMSFNYYIAASPNFERDTTLLSDIEKKISENDKFHHLLYVSKEMSYSSKDSAEYVKFNELLDLNNSKIRYRSDYFPNESHVSMAPISLVKGLTYIQQEIINKNNTTP